MYKQHKPEQVDEGSVQVVNSKEARYPDRGEPGDGCGGGGRGVTVGEYGDRVTRSASCAVTFWGRSRRVSTVCHSTYVDPL